MTHFNHEWDTTKTPAVPVSVGDRYYAQDLNDDFNYLKHLPYEVFLQGRSRGVMVAPSDTYNNSGNGAVVLSGGFGVILQDCIELNPDENFVIPPKTHSSPRYERIPFVNTTVVLPNDNTTHYIVATPTKRSLLQRTKALFTEQYASRVRYDGVITIQNTAPTAGQILIGLCNNREYCLLIDNNPDQCKDNIILKKWFGQNKITQGFVSILQSYYNTSIASIETKISVDTVSGSSIYSIAGTFTNCTITISTISGGSSVGAGNGTFNNCIISIGTVSGGTNMSGINSGTFNNCTITVNTVSGANYAIWNCVLNNCKISIGTVNSNAYGIYNTTLDNCVVAIGTVRGNGILNNTLNTINDCTINIDKVIGNGNGIGNATNDKDIFNNCVIHIGTVNDSTGIGSTIYNDGIFSNCAIAIDSVINEGLGVDGGTYNDCAIKIGTVSGEGLGVYHGDYNNCTITIGTVSGDGSDGVNLCTCRDCIIKIGTVNIDTNGIYDCVLSNCAIAIGTVKGDGIAKNTLNNCTITISTINGGSGILNTSSVYLYLTRIICSAITDLSSTSGKLNVLNNTVFHAS